MRFIIRAEIRGRIRVHADIERMSLAEADILEYYLKAVPGVTRVKVFDRTRDAVIEFTCDADVVKEALARFCFTDEKAKALVPEHTSRASDREYEDLLAGRILARYAGLLLVPHPVREAWCIFKAGRFVAEALRTLVHGKLNVSVLDACAITVSIARGDHETASSVMFLLGVGDLLEEWAHKKSVEDLAGLMSRNVDKAWVFKDGVEMLIPVSDIKAGDEVIVRMGNMIPLDGKVTFGTAMVNQATMTGESMPVKKSEGSYVYGGTVVEEGECRFMVDKAAGSGRYDRIVKMIEESERLKSDSEHKASDLADRLVPYSLAGTAIAYALTRNAQAALSFLMVDYSCALKLTMPLAVLAAMRESGRHMITVKGGRFLEVMSEADTIVFDKTGTLTNAVPTVVDVIPFGGNDAHEMLRIAACLEEHYPHSIANAVVEAAKVRGLDHDEMHSEVEYVVAHGITSSIDGCKASIGSYHFIFEDENCVVPDGEEEKFSSLPEEYSLLYLAVSGKLAAVICIEDPIKEGITDVIAGLHDRGFSRIVMMTGDSEKTAAYVAAATGVDEYIAEVLPEDKATFVRNIKADGHTVVMIGDGINDSPALSEADAGIAVNTGAAIAKEISDITIESEDLNALLVLRDISNALMRRTGRDYRVIISFNSLLIALGAFGIIAPSTLAMLHNISTIGISIYNMTDLIKS